MVEFDCLFCCCCLLTKVLGLRAKLLITPGSKIFRQTSLGLQKGLSVYQKSEKVYWVNNQHEQTKSMQSQVKDLLLQSIHTRTFYLLSHAFRQFPKTVTTLIVYIYTDINRSHLMKFHKKVINSLIFCFCCFRLFCLSYNTSTTILGFIIWLYMYYIIFISHFIQHAPIFITQYFVLEKWFFGIS